MNKCIFSTKKKKYCKHLTSHLLLNLFLSPSSPLCVSEWVSVKQQINNNEALWSKYVPKHCRKNVNFYVFARHHNVRSQFHVEHGIYATKRERGIRYIFSNLLLISVNVRSSNISLGEWLLYWCTEPEAIESVINAVRISVVWSVSPKIEQLQRQQRTSQQMRQRKGKPLLFIFFILWLHRSPWYWTFGLSFLLRFSFFGFGCFGPIKPETSFQSVCAACA